MHFTKQVQAVGSERMIISENYNIKYCLTEMTKNKDQKRFQFVSPVTTQHL
jgi:hypothetical protein